MNKIRTILRQATRTEDEPLNILTFQDNERYAESLATTGHNFYAITIRGQKKWNDKFGVIPNNYHVLPETVDNLRIFPWVDIGVILTYNREQFIVAKNIADYLEIPIITVEKSLPLLDEDKVEKQNTLGSVNIFSSQYQVEQWGVANKYEINPLGIDTTLFSPDDDIEKENWALTVVNNWIVRDKTHGFSLWKEITGFPSPTPMVPHRIIGDTPGLSVSSPNLETLIKFYQMAGVYLNTSYAVPLPTAVIEAMACGCPVVSPHTCAAIEHGINGYISKDVDELREYTLKLLENKELAKTMGENARKTVIEKFSQEIFANQWNEILKRKVYNNEG